jgi:alpha-tubulin suppressor-like RCC1 family protein
MSDLPMTIKTDYSLWGWGYDGHGQLGLCTITQRETPHQIGTGYKVP